MNGGYSAMRKRTKYSKRILAVLLAVMMLLAAAQPVSFMAAVGEDPDPQFEQGIARARYTTNGTLELSFPVAVSQAGPVTYYADLYDLDRDYAGRETPLNAQPIKLDGARQTIDETNILISATLSSKQLAEMSGLDMAHRISVAVTAVDKVGWRSQPIEALVGESLSIPAVGSAPEGNFVTFEDFDETTSNGSNENSGKTPPAWMYNNVAGDEQTGNNNFTPANIDGAFFGSNSAYQTPGFHTSNAFRIYMKNAENNAFTQGSTPSSVNGYQRLDIGYTPSARNFVNANEMWIWVDTSYVNFKEFALQARYLDRGGDLYLNADLGTDNNSYVRDEQWVELKYSQDIYSTVGYAVKNNGASVPVYYQNEDGLWDTIYTNEKGYLENFGHYRGFLRVPVDKLWNETENSSHNQLTEERVYSYKIKIFDGYWTINKTVKEFTAREAYENPNETFSWQDTRGSSTKKWMYFNKDAFAQNYAPGLTVVPIEDIASVGITWKGASEDSVNKSFYIDQMGFSGTNMSGGTSVNSLTTSNTDAVQVLVEQYLPNDLNLVNISQASVIADLRAICTQLGVENTILTQAEQKLEALLEGNTNPVDWLSEKLSQLPIQNSYSAEEIEQIKNYFELYRTLTLGDIHRLGMANEAKLINAYNAAELSEWYPYALTNLYYKAFNDVEQNYTLGQTALNEYDDYRPGPDGKWHYYDRAHNLLWDDNYKGAWENSRNLVAYSRSSYDATETGANSADQRFGLASTAIGQNGFAGSYSIDTSFYRDSLVNGETYRISLTNGDNKNNWDELGSVNIGQATDFIFYADFSEMNDLRKLWIALRTADGKVYSHDEDDGAQWDYQILNINEVNPEWQTRKTDNDGPDGCLTGDSLNGFRGFIQIPLSHFREIGNKKAAIPANSDVKQMKLFYTGTQGGTSPAGTSIYLDMFGFVSSAQGGGFEQLKPQIVTAPDVTPSVTVDTTKAAILALYKDVTLLGQTEAMSNYLFNYSNQNADVDAYHAMLEEYYTLTIAQKAELEQDAEVSGKIAEMASVVRNYDTYNNVPGNLQKYVTNTNAQFHVVVDNFKTNAVDTAPIVAVLKEYEGYPAKYQNTVQTYWADRNLHAVYPNFMITTPASSEPKAPVATMRLNDTRTDYMGSITLNYYAAVDNQNPINLVTDPAGKITLRADDGSGETVEVNLGGGIANPLNGNHTMTFNLAVPETEVTHAATYCGAFEVLMQSPAIDDGTNQPSNPKEGGITSAEQYRMQSYTVYVELVCEASYTVVIPADATLAWNQTEYVMGDLEVRLSAPSTASLDVYVKSENNYKLTGNQTNLAYSLLGGISGFGEYRRFTTKTAPTLPLTIQVAQTEFNAAPYDAYQDVLTFTVDYQENR